MCPLKVSFTVLNGMGGEVEMGPSPGRGEAILLGKLHNVYLASVHLAANNVVASLSVCSV